MKNMSMDFWNNFWTALGVIFSFIISAVAVGISLKSYKQTEKQIELSNKQQLFEIRFQSYLEGKKLLNMYGSGKELLDLTLKNDLSTPAPFFTMYTKIIVLFDEFFSFKLSMSDNTDINVEEVYCYMANIKSKAEQLELVFNQEEIKYLHDFMMDYVTLLNRMIPYYRTLQRLDVIRQEVMKEGESYEKFAEEMAPHQEIFNEREELRKLKEQIVKIKESYSRIDKDYLSALEKKMRL